MRTKRQLSSNDNQPPANDTAPATDARLIESGSRPSSKFDDDSTVSCSDNPYPLRCQTSYSEEVLQSFRYYESPYYASNNNQLDHGTIKATRLPCTDFYNYSDGGLLWWQALQREATFLPEWSALYTHNHQSCTDHSSVNFLIRKNSTTGLPDVDGLQGLHLHHPAPNSNASIVACNANDYAAFEDSESFNVIYSLTYCLYNYGEGLRKYMPEALDAFIARLKDK